MPQRTASDWRARAEDAAGELPDVVQVESADVLVKGLPRLASGHGWAVGDLVDVIRARQEQSGGTPTVAFVVSQAVTGANISKMVRDALDTFDLPVLESRTGHRVAYAEAMMQGRFVLDRSSSNDYSTFFCALTGQRVPCHSL